MNLQRSNRSPWLAALLLLCMGSIPALAQDACDTPRLLSPVGTTLPRDGFGLVVADNRATPTGEVALVRGRRRTPLTRVEIMPGLYRYSAAVRPGTYRLDGIAAPSDIVISARSARPATATRPEVRAARRVARAELGSASSQQEIHIELGFPVPAGSVAARVQWNESTSGGQWVPATPGETSIIIPVEPACRALSTTTAPTGAFTLQAAFIDTLGQVSAFSAPVSVE